ncbi:MAG: hypothetical protein P1U87_19660 [Verrucomicrobiales bacterium]|nr:hypothetical protein [Verrucomicrobiales bacterium]
MARGLFQTNWVVALKPEGRAVIEKFGLTPSGERGLFPVFTSGDQSMQLVVSGPGKVQAAAATAHLASLPSTRSADATVWINFGIAGSGGPDYGKTYLAGKIEDLAVGKSWYPVATWSRKRDLERRTIRTVDQPCGDYPDGDALVEMEASGFYPVATRMAGAELCHVLKVVSDDPGHPIHLIDKAIAKQLCQVALDHAADWFSALCELGQEEADRLGDPPGFREILKAAHFTVTQQHQLRRLLQQWQARNGDLLFSAGNENAREILHRLRNGVSSP